MMVFCLDRVNFDNFRYVEGLVKSVKQYNMLVEWSAVRKRPAEGEAER